MLNLPRLVVIATIAACAVVASGMGAIGYERYATVQGEAQEALQSAIADGRTAGSLASQEQATLERQITDAEQQLTDSAGKTLDEAARTVLTKAIAGARTMLLQQKARGREFAAALALAEQAPSGAAIWPPDQLAIATTLKKRATAETGTVTIAVASLGKGVAGVQLARVAWQTEQDRAAAAAATQAQAAADAAAAEAAARLAKARTIASASTVTESGGATAPSAPAPPSAPIAPVAGFDIEGYVLALAPNSYISWVDSLCSGYYVCGRAWVGGVNSTPVKIELDPALRDIYANRIGISVLVHESAHARQWLYYGADIISANEALTGLTGPPAVEYMADCATIVKLGYSTGTYTSSCTADQLDAAALIW